MLGSLVEGFCHDLFASMREATPIPYPFPVEGQGRAARRGLYRSSEKSQKIPA